MADAADTPNPIVGDRTVLSDLVARALEHREESGPDIPFDEICSDHPELQIEVERAVDRAERIRGMHGAEPVADSMLNSLVVGRYRIHERIGSGAMGVVYAATDTELGRRVAIKVMHERLLDRSTTMARFEREAESLAAIDHESIVTIFDRGLTRDGSSFLVMELVEGTPCSEILEHAKAHAGSDDASWLTEACGIELLAEPSMLRHGLRWAAEVAGALEAAHGAGVFHRDVKPSNIIVRPDGRAVLLDFGVAAMADHAPLTRADSPVGTPAYMPPESLRGSHKPSHAQDVYGLAATLYHLLTLQPPYRGSTPHILGAVASSEPALASKVRPGLPRDAQAILDHGLAREPGSRYSSVGGMEADLRALLAHRPVSVRSLSTARRLFRRLRRSKVFLGAALASLLMAGLFGARHWRSSILDGRAEAFQEAWPRIPTNFAILQKAHRAVPDGPLRIGLAAAFDDLVASDHDPIQAYTLRAFFHLDHGEVEAAKADARMLASAAGTEYTRELSRRYQALAPGARGADALGLEDLPDPRSDGDLYVSLLHGLYTKTGAPHLLDERLDGVRHVEAIRLLFKLAALTGEVPMDEARARYEDLDVVFNEARSLLEGSGYHGAMLGHIMATARSFQSRWAECLQLSKQVIERSPASYATLQNAGEAARRLERFDVARSMAERAIAIAPRHLVLSEILAKTEAGAGNFERAMQIVEGAPFPDTASGERARTWLRVRLMADRALDLRREDNDSALAVAEAALAQCQSLPSQDRERQVYEDLIIGLIDNDDARVFMAVLAQLEDQPDSTRVIGALAAVTPEVIEGAASAQLKEWLASLYLTLERNQLRGLAKSTPPETGPPETAPAAASTSD